MSTTRLTDITLQDRNKRHVTFKKYGTNHILGNHKRPREKILSLPRKCSPHYVENQIILKTEVKVMVAKLNYERWLSGQKKYLTDLSNKEIVLLFTGGKDSSLILDFMTRAKDEFGFNFGVKTCRYPNRCFPDKEVNEIDRYWQGRNVKIDWFKIEKDDYEFENALRAGKNPCTVCHSKKSDFLNRKISEDYKNPNNLVIIYGFVLFDMVSYSLEYLLGVHYNSDSNQSLHQGSKIKERFENQLSLRFFPFLKRGDGYLAFCPLLEYNDSEINEAIKERKIPLLEVDCEYEEYRPKRIFSEVYDKMGMNFDYRKVRAFAQTAFSLNDHISKITHIDEK